MKTLILETSSDLALLALTQEKETLFSLSLPGGSDLSKTLGLKLEQLLAQFPPPYDRIVLGIGPGSYTGVRVGAAMAQALCFAWNIPLYTAPSLSAFASPQPHAVICDARSGGFYIQIDHSAPIKTPLEKALDLLAPIPLLLSPHPSLLAARLPTLTFAQAIPDPHLLIQAATPTPLDQLNLLYL